ncbi:hypothetical protein [Sphingomonas sp.]|uniref:hypothetical protein n=1 Tax=Sphingomonas sp. TaxID=28214 RepID=UPI0028A821BD|nr:hypothetical protein [Sphingomonas sp.]
MTRLALTVTRHGRQWCDIVIDTAGAEDVARDLLQRLPEMQGFRCQTFREEEARRIVEITDQARLLSVKYVRVPFDIGDEERGTD